MDDRSGDERAETAEFAPARVGGRGSRARSPLVVLGWAAAIIAVVGLGLAGQAHWTNEPTLASGGPPAQLQSAAPAIAAGLLPSPAQLRSALLPADTAQASPVGFVTRRDGTSILVTGLTAAYPVASVLISVQDAAGSPITGRSLAVSGPDGIRRDQGPVFEATIVIPAGEDGRALVVVVNARDALGRRIGTIAIVVPSFAHDPSTGRKLRLACCGFSR